MNFILVILAIVVIVFAFKFNVLLGVVVTAAIVGYTAYLMIPNYYAMMGNKAFAAGDEEMAREWYKKAYDTGRTKIVTKTSYAYILLRTGYADEAEKVLDPIVRVKNLAPEKKNLAKQQRCMVYYKQGRLDEAIEDAESMMKEGFKTTHLYGMLGYFKLLRNDSLDETVKFCEEAYDYNSDDRDIKDNLSLCYYRMGRYEDAQNLSDELVEAEPKFIEGNYHGAQIAVKLGDYQKAEELVDRLAECKRSGMTTISEEEIAKLTQEVKNHNENTIS